MMVICSMRTKSSVNLSVPNRLFYFVILYKKFLLNIKKCCIYKKTSLKQFYEQNNKICFQCKTKIITKKIINNESHKIKNNECKMLLT